LLSRTKIYRRFAMRQKVASRDGDLNIGYRWAAMLLAGPLMASGAFAQTVLYSYTTTNPGVGALVATTAPPSGSYRGEYVVTMSQASTGGAVELRAFRDSTTELTRVGGVTLDEEPINAYALATLDANRVVSAYVDTTGTLYVSVWSVGVADFYLQGQNSASSSGILEPFLPNSAPLGVSITALSPTEVVTAATDPSGNLRVQTWGISATGAVTPPQDTAIGGPITYPYIVAINASQVVTVDDTNLHSEYPTASSMRELIVWQINSEGGITQQGSVREPENGLTFGLANGPLGGFLGGGYSVITPSVDVENFSLSVTSWNISQTGGDITQGTTTSTKNVFSDQWGSAAIAWSPNLAPFSATAGGPAPDGDIELELWGIQNNSWYPIDKVPDFGGPGGYAGDYGVIGVAVAAEGTAGSDGYFVVVFTNASGNVVLQVCSAPYV
jgi:hypothetical protein